MKRKVSSSPEPGYSHIPSATGHEDNTPLVLASLGWTCASDGQEELRLECNTLVDYVTMPKELLFAQFTLVKAGWEEGMKAARYRRDDALHLRRKTNSQ